MGDDPEPHGLDAAVLQALAVRCGRGQIDLIVRELVAEVGDQQTASVGRKHELRRRLLRQDRVEGLQIRQPERQARLARRLGPADLLNIELALRRLDDGDAMERQVDLLRLLLGFAIRPLAAEFGLVLQLEMLHRDDPAEQRIAPDHIKGRHELIGEIGPDELAAGFARLLQRVERRVVGRPHNSGAVGFARELEHAAALTIARHFGEERHLRSRQEHRRGDLAELDALMPGKRLHDRAGVGMARRGDENEVRLIAGQKGQGALDLHRLAHRQVELGLAGLLID